MKPTQKCTLRKAELPELEMKLYRWFLAQREKNMPVSGDMIKQKFIRGNEQAMRMASTVQRTLRGKDAKEQWRKLRECHREAIRRQQKKSGQQTTTTKPWTYQKQMEFLKPYMKNRLIAG
ncbi:unnamed protein product [Acanthoscelides obtectus]|uniref:HTH CENPB-type domain-containing protein n=1 Tax=Acanthoscelides obtectus TaxID=200917 RepID=A0A9P0PS85_ACAOB|nr:unnamed protein product [Acanthoscelides obtectus]CAK1650264.1 hypothetical protein AOBTE_LOCUS16721 [Acanthoscelides obtectus]